MKGALRNCRGFALLLTGISSSRTNVRVFVICCCCTVAPIVTVNRHTVYQALGYRMELQCFGEGNPSPVKDESYWTTGDEVRLPGSSDEYVFIKCLP